MDEIGSVKQALIYNFSPSQLQFLHNLSISPLILIQSISKLSQFFVNYFLQLLQFSQLSQ